MSIQSMVTIWLYLVAATVAEVAVFYARPGAATVDGTIAVIAAVNAILTAAFSMNLKGESKALQYFILVPVSLIAVLILSMVFAFPSLN